MESLGIDTDVLLRRVAEGDSGAIDPLLTRHRAKLQRMVRVHLDDRLAARVDSSDIVQETLTEASQKIGHYARDRPIAFYPWLRQIAWQRLRKIHEYHFAQKRTVMRERRRDPEISTSSLLQLVERFGGTSSSPSEQAARNERNARLRDLLHKLSSRDQEVLVLRYLEQLSPSECGQVLGICHEAFKKRHLRAVQRLRNLLESLSRDLP